MVSGLVDAVAVVQGETGVGAGKRGVYKQQQELVFLHSVCFYFAAYMRVRPTLLGM